MNATAPNLDTTRDASPTDGDALAAAPAAEPPGLTAAPRRPSS
jgi:hypothetical protein